MFSFSKFLSTTLTLSGLSAPIITTVHLLLNIKQLEKNSDLDITNIYVQIQDQKIFPSSKPESTNPSSAKEPTTTKPEDSNSGEESIVEIGNNSEGAEIFSPEKEEEETEKPKQENDSSGEVDKEIKTPKKDEKDTSSSDSTNSQKANSNVLSGDFVQRVLSKKIDSDLKTILSSFTETNSQEKFN